MIRQVLGLKRTIVSRKLKKECPTNQEYMISPALSGYPIASATVEIMSQSNSVSKRMPDATLGQVEVSQRSFFPCQQRGIFRTSIFLRFSWSFASCSLIFLRAVRESLAMLIVFCLSNEQFGQQRFTITIFNHIDANVRLKALVVFFLAKGGM